MYLLQGKLSAKENNQELLNILLEASAQMQKTTGCHLYLVATEEGNDKDVFITEVWESKEHHAGSLKEEVTISLIKKAMPIIEMPPQPGKEFWLKSKL